MVQRDTDAVDAVQAAVQAMLQEFGRFGLGRKADRKVEGIVNPALIAVIDALAAGSRDASGDIAARLNVERATAQRILGAAIKAGYAESKAVEVGVRDSVESIALTGRGEALGKGLAAMRQRFFASHLKGWSDDECAAFVRLLQKFAGREAAWPERVRSQRTGAQVIAHPALKGKARRRVDRLTS